MEVTPPNTLTCYRHHDRRAGVRCQRCERPICPSCMTTASVGFHCPECARRGKQKVYTRATLAQANRPWLSQALVAVNVGVFLLGVAMSSGRDMVVGSGELALRGGLIADSILLRTGEVFSGVADGAWYRIVTAGFLHAGLIHLAFNMLALFRVGQVIEPMIGRARFAAAYATSLLAGSFAALLLSPDNLTVGASGAIFGLFGVLFLAVRARGIDPWSSGIGMTIGLNLLITFTLSDYISVGGHVGGLIGGFAAGFVFFDIGPKQLRSVAMEVALVVALGAACAVGSVLIA